MSALRYSALMARIKCPCPAAQRDVRHRERY